MRGDKIISWLLGVSMFMFGILKFFNPFKEWYTVQIAMSGLGRMSYALGIAGEIGVGVTILICMILSNRISAKVYAGLLVGSSVVVIVMMVTGIYVHLNPDVPANVLPLKIKPPYIPGIFMLLALVNIYNNRNALV